jgi:hypothetical protein
MLLLFRGGVRPGRYDFIGMKKLITTLAVVLCCTLGGVALAGDPHTSGTKGQPNQSCEDMPGTTPGHSTLARGAAFNPNGVAGAVYANPTSQGGISSGNTHVVSQYDVACYQQSLRMSQQAARISQQSARISVGHGGGRGR